MKKSITFTALTLILLAAFALNTGCLFMKAPGNNKPVQVQKTESNAQQGESEDGTKLSFSTTDIDGNPVSMADFADKKVVMINFWEAWCSPCVGEIPDIEALYEKYADRGFMVLGVYSNSGADEIKALASQLGITYPVFAVTEELSKHQTRYVPTTVFVSGDGMLLTDEPYVGSMEKDEWESIIKELLGV